MAEQAPPETKKRNSGPRLGEGPHELPFRRSGAAVETELDGEKVGILLKGRLESTGKLQLNALGGKRFRITAMDPRPLPFPFLRTSTILPG